MESQDAVMLGGDFENDALQGLQAEIRDLQRSERGKIKDVLIKACEFINANGFYETYVDSLTRRPFLHALKDQEPSLRVSIIQNGIEFQILDSRGLVFVYDSMDLHTKTPHLPLIRIISCERSGRIIRLEIVGIIDDQKKFIAIDGNTGFFHGKRLFEMVHYTNRLGLKVIVVPVIDQETSPLVCEPYMIYIDRVIKDEHFKRTKNARS